MPEIKHTKITILLTFLILLIGSVSVYALDITSKEDMKVDTSLINIEDNFGLADSIAITPLFLDLDSFVSDADWYRGLFYYQTVRLNQGDVLFHYIVFSDGTVIEGNSKGDDQRVGIEGESAPITIAYFSGTNTLDFEPEAKEAISQLILDIANNHAIPLSDVSVKRVDFIAKNQEAVKIRTDIIGGRWERSLKSMIESITPNYQPVEKQFSLTIEKVEVPQEPVKYGDDIVARITIKNDSPYALFQGTDDEILISRSFN